MADSMGFRGSAGMALADHNVSWCVSSKPWSTMVQCSSELRSARFDELVGFLFRMLCLFDFSCHPLDMSYSENPKSPKQYE